MIQAGDPNTIAEMISKGSMQCAVKQRIQDASGASFKFSLFGLARHLRSLFLKLGKSTDAANGFNMVTSHAARMYMVTKSATGCYTTDCLNTCTKWELVH